MTYQQDMSRLLFHHDWSQIEEWAQCLRSLAKLYDAEIAQLADNKASTRQAEKGRQIG